MKLLILWWKYCRWSRCNQSYVDILKESLLKKGIEVINRSRHRETTFDGIGTFNEDIANFGPDILLSNSVLMMLSGMSTALNFRKISYKLSGWRAFVSIRSFFLATSHTFDNPHDMDAVYIFYRSLRIVASDLGRPVYSSTQLLGWLS